MRYVDAQSHATYVGAGGPEAPVIYIVDLPYHPFDLASIARGRNANLVRLPIHDWNASLTPWPAPALRGEEADFRGDASRTFEELVSEAIPAIERAEELAPSRRGICGYSLAGLFALYAFTRGYGHENNTRPSAPFLPNGTEVLNAASASARGTSLQKASLQANNAQVKSANPQGENIQPTIHASTGQASRAYPFQACACLSGSVWYQGWVDYLHTLEFDASGRYAYLSVGSREKNAGIPILRTVKKNMQACAQILEQHGCEVDYEVGPGNHFEHTQERFDAGVSALDDFLARP